MLVALAQLWSHQLVLAPRLIRLSTRMVSRTTGITTPSESTCLLVVVGGQPSVGHQVRLYLDQSIHGRALMLAQAGWSLVPSPVMIQATPSFNRRLQARPCL